MVSVEKEIPNPNLPGLQLCTYSEFRLTDIQCHQQKWKVAGSIRALRVDFWIHSVYADSPFSKQIDFLYVDVRVPLCVCVCACCCGIMDRLYLKLTRQVGQFSQHVRDLHGK